MRIEIKIIAHDGSVLDRSLINALTEFTREFNPPLIGDGVMLHGFIFKPVSETAIDDGEAICPQCSSHDPDCLYCEGRGHVTANHAKEWHRQNATKGQTP